MQRSWLKFLHFFIPMTVPVYLYINYTKHTICYLKISACFVLKASSWLRASKVTFYFVLTPFPAMCKSVIWLLYRKFFLKFCPLHLQPVKHIGGAPCRRHRSSALWQSSSWAPTQLENPAASQDTGTRGGAQNWEAAAKSCPKHFAPCLWKSGLGNQPWLCPATCSCYEPTALPNNKESENLLRLHSFMFRNPSEQHYPCCWIQEKVF